MEDFVDRTKTQLRFLAIDITAEFYKDLYRQYIDKDGWPFEFIEEVTLYDAMGMAIFKKDYAGGKVELDLVELEEPSAKLQDAKDKLAGVFTKIDENINTDCGATVWVKRPRICMKKLVVRDGGNA